MHTFLLSNLYLVPFLTFTILASTGRPLLGAGIGLLAGIMFWLYKYGGKRPTVFMSGQVLAIAVLFAVLVMELAPPVNLQLAFLFICLAVGVVAGIAYGLIPVRSVPFQDAVNAAQVQRRSS